MKIGGTIGKLLRKVRPAVKAALPAGVGDTKPVTGGIAGGLPKTVKKPLESIKKKRRTIVGGMLPNNSVQG